MHNRIPFLQIPTNPAETQRSWSHWLLVALFGALCLLPISGKLLFILGFVLFTALIKGPIMLVVGTLLAGLIGLFPPLAWVLPLFIFLNELFFLVRNWRFGVIAGFFFAYPFLRLLIERALPYPPLWERFGTLTLGILSFYSLLLWFYRKNPNSHALVWSIISWPFDFLVRFFPHINRSNRSAQSPISKRKFWRS